MALAFAQVLERLDLSVQQSEIFSADEVDTWSPGTLEEFLSLRLISPASPANSVLCDACTDSHIAFVRHITTPPDDTGLRAYVECEELGLVPIDQERLLQWKASLTGLASIARPVVNSKREPRVILEERLVDLGTGVVAERECRIYVARGLNWDDGDDVLTHVRQATGATEALILVPSIAIVTDDPLLSVIPFAGNVAVRGQELLLELPSLREPGPSWAGRSPLREATLTNEEEQAAEKHGFKGRILVEIGGLKVSKKSNVVTVGGQDVLLDDASFIPFLRLVVALFETEDGFLSREALRYGQGVDGEVELIPAGFDQAIGRMRGPFRRRVGALTHLEFIEVSRGRVRLSVPRACLSVEEEQLQEHPDQRVRTMARRIKEAKQKS